MKNSIQFKKAVPYISAVVIFIVICIIYCSPQLEGYTLFQGDHMQYLGMSKEITDFREEFNEEPLWTNSMFSGMPAYQISTRNPNIINSIKNVILKIIPRPAGYFLLLMTGFFILLLCFDVKPWLAIIGSIAFGLSSFNVLYLGAGHNAKILALSFIPPLTGSIIYAYRKNFLIGGALLSIFTCLHLSANHVQLTYYLLFLILAIILVELYRHIKSNKTFRFIKASGILILAGIIGLLPVISNLMITNEYGKYTTRGKSELTIRPENAPKKENDALDKEYIKTYNLGVGELWSLVIPNVKGGSHGQIKKYPDVVSKINPQYRGDIAERSSYWGEQSSSGGAFYYGATIFLLFLLGAFFVKDKIKWALIGVSVLAILLSLKYSGLVDAFIAHFPLFNKFRDTKMMLILVQISFPLLGLLFLHRLMNEGIDRKKFLYVSLGLSGLFLLFYVMPTVWFKFIGKQELQAINDQMANIRNNAEMLRQFDEWKNELVKARIAIFRKDTFRSLFFILAATGTIYLFIQKKMKETTFLMVLGLLVLIDFWFIDKRYLNNEKQGENYLRWVDSYRYDNPYMAGEGDMGILTREVQESPALSQRIQQELGQLKINHLNPAEQQTEREKAIFKELYFSTHYRVMSLPDPFNESQTSYYHKSIGGYHGAKLKKYQEVIEFHIGKNVKEITGLMSNDAPEEYLDDYFRNIMPVVNMLNTKYIVYNRSKAYMYNPYHYGNAWFVDSIIFVPTADEEITALSKVNKNKVFVREEFRQQVIPNPVKNISDTIELVTYKPNHLTYRTSASHEQFAVFSEVYYDAGWNAYIDGKKTDYVKANYILRAMNVPKGEHTIEFKFEPQSYYKGRKISVAGSWLIVIFVAGIFFYEMRKKKNAAE